MPLSDPGTAGDRRLLPKRGIPKWNLIGVIYIWLRGVFRDNQCTLTSSFHFTWDATERRYEENNNIVHVAWLL